MDGHLISVKEVYNEIELQLSAKWIWTWAQAHKALFEPPTDDEGAFVGEIFSVPHFQSLVGETPAA